MVAPAALWAALAVGLQLCAAGHALPPEGAISHHTPEPGSRCQQREYYDERTQRCCRQCPPGQHVQRLCTRTSDTVCVPCEISTYTQLWNWVSECLSCGARCRADQVEAQACTREQNRICTCKAGSYCTLGRREGCRLCMPLRSCPPGFGVTKPGTATSNVVCAACAPGTFSDTTSSTDTCRPHRTCSLVATPGTASTNTICKSVAPNLTTVQELALTPRPGSSRSQHVEPSPGLSTAPNSSPLLPMGPSPPVEGVSTGGISLPIGLIAAMTALGLLVIGLVNCVIVTQKKKKPLICLQGEAKVPHLPADKARPGPEQQHLLTTAPSSSSSSLESSASATDRRAAPRSQQTPGPEKAKGSGEARASSASSEPSPGGHGTQVNVTCIVNVCSSSDHGSQCPSQASSTAGDTDASPSGSPKNEQVPFSKEERPFQSPLGTPETLPQSFVEKPLPLGVPDAGMRPS
ncbi:tumor necrosis factor receptor superfamily member 1B isoform X2 [Dasypus novemcinctus]|uniref:tumor necrosis factor receptor superfamily member 1B isoform X2 n=1 Tax=Dasypus novemcinctus TaxID=9361 RepID=UPI0003292A8C|nr:tumor necrosis factor receptor superfamily member 1B isoform X2 [Dasypus novemcinctus]